MHGVINRSLECFLRDTYGDATWDAIARGAGLGTASFEAMLSYDDALTDAVIDVAARILHRSRASVLEDLGHYLISEESLSFLRRLLRFSGGNFADFMASLEELPERARLVLPDLEVPDLMLADHGGGQFTLTCRARLRGAGQVVLGLLRAMADDYGALVLMEAVEGAADGEMISIQIADQDFAEARPFSLGMTVM